MVKFHPDKSTLICILKWCLIIIFVAIAANNLHQSNLPYVDDAYIFLRYANNIVHGYGFVWNPGTAPVEGYTSFLYLLLIVIIRFLGGSTPAVLGWLGVVFSTLTLLLTVKLVETILPDKPLMGIFVVAMLGFSPGFFYWTTGGMDVPLFSALILAATITYLESNDNKRALWIVGLLFTLVALARPEGLILFFLTVIFEIVNNYSQEKKISFRDILLLCAPFAVIYVPYFLWRWSYFGYLFPNTYFDKTGAGMIQLSGGVSYWYHSMINAFGPALILCVFLFVFVPIVRSKKIDVKIAYLLLTMISIWGYVIVNGGDHFGEGRFILPSIPYFLTLVGSGFMVLYNKNRLATVLGVLVVILWAFNSIGDDEFKVIQHNLGNVYHARTDKLPVADSSRYEVYDQYVPAFVIMGKTLNKITAPGESVAVIPIGAIGYFSDIKVIDMLGVVDPVIAHEPFDPNYIKTWRPGHDKGDGKYILSLHPDYIQLCDYLTSQPSPGPNKNELQYKSVVEIWASQEFHNEYEFDPVAIGNGWYYNLYRRKAP